MCEKCLYKKNCQFLAKQKPSSAVVGCTAFEKDIDVLTKEIKSDVAREIIDEFAKMIMCEVHYESSITGYRYPVVDITEIEFIAEELKKKYSEGTKNE